MRTYYAKPQDIERKWYIIDAADQVLGRLAVKAADILRGKNKTMFTPSVDTGDYVIVVNAEKVRVTGKKADQKTYANYSGYPGGLKIKSYSEMMAKKPTYIIEHAVRGMIPHTKLGDAIVKKLKVYAGADHPHTAQSPEPITI
ncbi:50S ribosomal protein L13 [bacterium]|nr:50S ribosomal protein L13 [bacterium]